jgi:hypothetical protein
MASSQKKHPSELPHLTGLDLDPYNRSEVLSETRAASASVQQIGL